MEQTVILRRGLLLGDRPQTEAVLRESTVEDVLSAHQASANPIVVGADLIRRQLVRIGEIKAPITPEMFGKMLAADLERLQGASAELEKRGHASAES